jgi:hypothetical protein
MAFTAMRVPLMTFTRRPSFADSSQWSGPFTNMNDLQLL